MTKFSTNGARPHETGLLGVTRGSGSTEGAYILGALRSHMFRGLTLEASCGGGSGRFVGDEDRIATGARLHNHLQSSREHSTSIAHAWSSSPVASTPTSLSRCCISAVTFYRGKGGGGSGATRGKRKGSSGQLWRRIDGSIGGG